MSFVGQSIWHWTIIKYSNISPRKMSEWKQNRPIHHSISSSWFVQIARTSCRCDISSSSNLLIAHFQGKFPSKTSSAVAVIISASNSCEKCRLKYLIMWSFSWLEYLTKNSKNVLCAYPSKYTHIQSGTFVASGKKDTPAVELCLPALGTFPGNLQCFCSFGRQVVQ